MIRRPLAAAAGLALAVSLAACGMPSGTAANFMTTGTSAAAAAPASTTSSPATTAAAAAAGTMLLDGQPVEHDPRVAVSGTDEERAGLPFDWAFRDAVPVAAAQVVNLDQPASAVPAASPVPAASAPPVTSPVQPAGNSPTAIEQALVSTANRLATRQQVDFLPVDVRMVPLSLVSNPQTGEIRDGQLPMHTMRQPIVTFSSQQGTVSATLIELQSLTRQDLADFDRLARQKRPASSLANSFLQEDSLGYTTLTTDIRPDGSATLLRGRTFSAACQPADVKDCIYIDDHHKEGFGLQGKPLVLIRSVLQRLDLGASYGVYDGPFVYVTPLYTASTPAQPQVMDTAHGIIKFRTDDTTSRRPVSTELRILQLSAFPENTAAMSPATLQSLSVYARP